jgi:hypothetical protein
MEIKRITDTQTNVKVGGCIKSKTGEILADQNEIIDRWR